MRLLLLTTTIAAIALAGCGIGNPWPAETTMTGSSAAHHER